MITQISLTHFKCFEVLKLPLRPLTLLSGPNASGKSAIMQALVLLSQTIRDNEWSKKLILNGSIIRLGTASDVIDQVYGHRECGIELHIDDRVFTWWFEGDRNDMAMKFSKVAVDGIFCSLHDGFQYLLPYSAGPFPSVAQLLKSTYLTAERLGPREVYPLGDIEDIEIVGSNGEHAVSILYANMDSKLSGNLVDEIVPPTLLKQVEARMARFFPSCVIDVTKIPRANAATLGLRTSNSTGFHRPIHTGFGLTQVLPIVVAAFWAKPNNLILIENPEVHLHPAAQVEIGEFLAQVASSGVQVIIETHSDHVLNGIRRAVKKEVLSNDSVALHFFRPRTEESDKGTSQVESPLIDAKGNIDNWPIGFFDQFDIDMNYFAGWS